MNAHELKGKALEMLATVQDQGSLAQILHFIEQFVPGESLDMLAPDDNTLSPEQAAELNEIALKSRSGEATVVSKEAFFKGYEQWVR